MTKRRPPRTADASDLHAGDVQVGDIIVFLGQPHLIDELEPYTHPEGMKGQIARAGDWGIVLFERGPFGPFVQLRRARPGKARHRDSQSLPDADDGATP